MICRPLLSPVAVVVLGEVCTENIRPGRPIPKIDLNTTHGCPDYQGLGVTGLGH